MYSATSDTLHVQPVRSAQQVLTGSGDMRYHVKPILRPLGFDKGFYVCVRALQLLVQHNQGCVFVGVGGAAKHSLDSPVHKFSGCVHYG